MNKPIVSYHKGNDPTRDFNKWKDNLTEINVIRTKVLTDEFIDFCVLNHKRIFLHIVIISFFLILYTLKILYIFHV